MKVNTDELNRQASELRQIAGRLNDIQDSVLRITRNLCRESVGERFRYPLMDAARAIGNRSEDMRKLRTALNQIARTYEGTEMRILDEADHAAVHHENHNIVPIPIPGIIRDFFSIEPIRPIGPDGMLRILPEGENLRDILEDVLDRWQNQEAIDYQRNWHRDFWDRRNIPEIFRDGLLRDILEERHIAGDERDIWNQSRREVAENIPGPGPLDPEIYREFFERMDPARNIADFHSIEDIRNFWNQSRRDNIRQFPEVNMQDFIGGSENAGTGEIPRNAQEIINTIGEAVQEAFADNPSDTIGTGAIPEAARRILDTVDGAVQQVGEGIADMFDGGSAIDWTPWNP